LTIPGKSTPFDATIPKRRSARWDRSKRREVKLMAPMRMAFFAQLDAARRLAESNFAGCNGWSKASGARGSGSRTFLRCW
jgi:hypothetical protein